MNIIILGNEHYVLRLFHTVYEYYSNSKSEFWIKGPHPSLVRLLPTGHLPTIDTLLMPF